MRRAGPYQLQAAIAALHDEAATPGRDRLAADRGALRRARRGSPVAGRRAQPRGRAWRWPEGPAAGLALMDRVAAGRMLDDYPYLHAARADLLRRLGRRDEAAPPTAGARADRERGGAGVPRAADRGGGEPSQRALMAAATVARWHHPPFVRGTRSSCLLPCRGSTAQREPSLDNFLNLLVEALFGLVFLGTLVLYLRRRDPLAREVALAFSGLASLFVIAVLQRAVGDVPDRRPRGDGPAPSPSRCSRCASSIGSGPCRAGCCRPPTSPTSRCSCPSC